MNLIVPAICMLLLDTGGQSVHTLEKNNQRKIPTSSIGEGNQSAGIVLPLDGNSSMLIGVNALYWVENDILRAKKGYIKELKKLHIQTMRFPGGEVADNYDWRTNTLNDPKRWPTSKSPDDAKKRMDFDEFMQLQKTLGSEPLIVVNLENGFVTGDLEKAADVAAAWVRYANIEKHYNVKYWEIGNESYLIQTRYPLTAKEYAKAFNLFAKKMKEVDPTIKLGANGPFNLHKISLIDKLLEKNQFIIRKISDNRRKKKKALELFFNQKKFPKSSSWWSVVARNCKKNLDFIALHHYINVRKMDRDMTKSLNIFKKIRKFSLYFKKKFGYTVSVKITEWNIKNKNYLSKKKYIKTILEALQEFEDANVSAEYFWPLRTMKGWRGWEEIYND